MTSRYTAATQTSSTTDRTKQLWSPAQYLWNALKERKPSSEPSEYVTRATLGCYGADKQEQDQDVPDSRGPPDRKSSEDRNRQSDSGTQTKQMERDAKAGTTLHPP